MTLPSRSLIFDIPGSLPTEESTTEERTEFNDSANETEINDYWDAIFVGDDGTAKTKEVARLQRIKDYTLNMLDAFVGTTFDQTGAQAFLEANVATHESDNYVAEFAASQPTKVFFIRDDASTPLVQFQSDGNVLLLEGSLQQNQSSIGATSASEFIVKNASGQISALIDNTNGNFKLKSNHVVADTLQTTTASELVIRNLNDAGNAAQVIVTKSGQLRTRGGVFEDSNL